jgi:hypothetical protein
MCSYVSKDRTGIRELAGAGGKSLGQTLRCQTAKQPNMSFIAGIWSNLNVCPEA